MKLRNYQVKAFNEVLEYIKEGHKSIMVVMPTGSGKTVLFAYIIWRAIQKATSCEVNLHLDPLFDQTIKTLVKLGVPEIQIGIVKAHHKIRDDALCKVNSLQTLERRRKYAMAQQPKIAFWDEAHLTAFRKISKEMRQREGVINIYFTATPYRSNPKDSMKDLATAIVKGPLPRELQQWGYLVQMKYYSTKVQQDTKGVKKLAGEFAEKELALRSDTPELVAAACEEWFTRTPYKRTIAFCVNKEHAKHVADEFNKRGISAAYVTDETSSEDRDRYYQQLETGELLLLASVNVLTIGFDSPSVEVGLFLRRTASLPLLLQMIGRIMRPSPETGKVEGIVIDQAGNLVDPQLMLPEEIDEWVLQEGSQVDGKAPRKTCPECQTVVQAGVKICPSCGYIFPRRELSEAVGRERPELELIDLAKRETPKVREYRRLLKDSFFKGYNPGYALHRWHVKFGKKQYPQKVWALGAIFGDAPKEINHKRYLQYLRACQAKNPEKYDDTWVKRYFEMEFGEKRVLDSKAN